MKVSVKEEVKNKKAKSVSSLELDLADFTSFREFETKVFNLVGKQKPVPALRFRVKATPLKDGKQIAAPETPRAAAAASASVAATTPAQTPVKPIAALGNDDDDSSEKNPFGSAPAGYAGNALFKRTDGTYDKPASLDATHAVLEKAKGVPVVTKDDTYTGNVLFKQAGSDEYKTPSRVAPSSTLQLMEESKAAQPAKQKEESNPFGPPPSAAPPAVAVVSPVSSTMGSPYGALSPSSEELQLLRKQNKMLQETLEKQEEKIDQLRQKMRVARSGPKSSSPPSPSLGGEAFLKEKEKALADASSRLAESDKQVAVQREQNEQLKRRVEELVRELEIEKRRADKLAKELESEKKRADKLVEEAKLKTQAAMEKRVQAEGENSAKVVEDLKSKLALANRDLSSQQLQVIELSNRLRDLESPQKRERKSSHDGEVKSLQMQLVAMEQDYESQLDELRQELQELRGGAGSGGEVRSGGERGMSSPSSSNEEVERLRAQVAELRQENAELKVGQSPMRGLAKNPLMEPPPPSSPFAAEEFGQLSSALGALQLAHDCVWSAKTSFDSQGVASACAPLIRRLNEDTLVGPPALEKLALAMETAALAQMGLSGRMYWLNAVSNLLDVFSRSPSAGIRSPKETGVIFFQDSLANVASSSGVPTLKKQASTVRRDLETVFVPRLQRVLSAIYRAVVEEVRSSTVGQALATSVLEPK
jgi:hypothetical protein